MKPHIILASCETGGRTKQFVEMRRFQVFQGLSGGFVYLKGYIFADHLYIHAQDTHTGLEIRQGVIEPVSARRPIFPTLVIL